MPDSPATPPEQSPTPTGSEGGAQGSGRVDALRRPVRHTELRSFAGHLDAAPDAVFAALVRRMHGVHGVAVDAAAQAIAHQGGWWYRGEYRVLAEPAEPGAAAAASGTRLEHEIVNVAQRWHWAAPLAGRRVLAEAPYAFHALLSEIERELAPQQP